LLEHVERLMQEVKELRAEMAEEREARATLTERRAKDAARKRDVPRKSEDNIPRKSAEPVDNPRNSVESAQSPRNSVESSAEIRGMGGLGGSLALSSSSSQEKIFELLSPVVPSSAEIRGEPEIERVFRHWQAERGREKSQLTEDRKRRIRARLREFTADQLCQAISGVKCDPWPERAQNDDLTQILRNAGQVERFLRFAQSGPIAPRGAVLSISDQAKQEHEIPGRKRVGAS
jgi:hypothetical protein